MNIKITIDCFSLCYYIITGIISIYFSFVAVDIHAAGMARGTQLEEYKDRFNKHWKIHNFFFHLVCQTVGWFIGYKLFVDYVFKNVCNLTFDTGVIILFALMSITGYLPPLIAGLVNIPKLISDYILDKMNLKNKDK